MTTSPSRILSSYRFPHANDRRALAAALRDLNPILQEHLQASDHLEEMLASTSLQISQTTGKIYSISAADKADKVTTVKEVLQLELKECIDDFEIFRKNLKTYIANV
jgi:Cu/Ag efflux protein CusF